MAIPTRFNVRKCQCFHSYAKVLYYLQYSKSRQQEAVVIFWPHNAYFFCVGEGEGEVKGKGEGKGKGKGKGEGKGEGKGKGKGQSKGN